MQCTLGRGARWGFRGRDVPRGLGSCHAARKDLWVETTCESVLLESIERGVRTFLFSSDEGEVADRRGWVASCLDRSTASTLPTAEIEDLNLLFSTGDGIRTESGAHFASSCTLETPEDTTRLSQSLGASSAGDLFVVHFHSSSKDDDVWKIIPAENLIAAKGMTGSKILPVCDTPGEATTMLTVLEAGTDGVVLRTEVPGAVTEVAGFLEAADAKETLAKATVTRVVFGGMGDRACVDLCALLKPGEGLLCGSFSRGLFLVHSECEESEYINSRPFRVNAGPVHSYVKMPGDRTAYLSELAAGDEVLVVSPRGEARVATVGRVKIEHRPLVRVDAREAQTGDEISVFLQNAETVKVVAPGGEAVPVTSLEPGDEVLCSYQEGARHTGIPVEERIVER
ncbi:3-dehydroquinate synthase [Chloropicon roscoffensis]